MTRLPATTAARFEHAVPIHGKTGIDWADPSGLGPVTGRSAWS
jgi:hypothetical protein